MRTLVSTKAEELKLLFEQPNGMQLIDELYAEQFGEYPPPQLSPYEAIYVIAAQQAARDDEQCARPTRRRGTRDAA